MKFPVWSHGAESVVWARVVWGFDFGRIFTVWVKFWTVFDLLAHLGSTQPFRQTKRKICLGSPKAHQKQQLVHGIWEVSTNDALQSC